MSAVHPLRVRIPAAAGVCCSRQRWGWSAITAGEA